MRLWFSRLLALLALAGAVAAVVFTVSTVGSSGGASPKPAVEDLNRANATLSGQLEALEAGTSPRQALDATRAAAELTRSLAESVEDPALAAALRAELDYLDAVGSTLNNPRSALRGRVGPRGDALRDALQAAPGGDRRVVSGGQELVAYSEARAGPGAG